MLLSFSLAISRTIIADPSLFIFLDGELEAFDEGLCREVGLDQGVLGTARSPVPSEVVHISNILLNNRPTLCLPCGISLAPSCSCPCLWTWEVVTSGRLVSSTWNCVSQWHHGVKLPRSLQMSHLSTGIQVRGI